MTNAVSVVVPGLTVRSEANTRGHWSKRYGRQRKQRKAVGLVLLVRVPPSVRRALAAAPRLRVTMRRQYAGRSKAMDTDNLDGAFKAIRDEVAEFLGRDDGPAAGIEWVTAQERCAVPGVRIDIREV